MISKINDRKFFIIYFLDGEKKEGSTMLLAKSEEEVERYLSRYDVEIQFIVER